MEIPAIANPAPITRGGSRSVSGTAQSPVAASADDAILPGFKPRRIQRQLFAVILMLVILHLTLGSAHVLLDSEPVSAVYGLFNMGLEYNVPAFVSASLWLLAALTACANAMARPEQHRQVRRWLFMAGLLAFLGLDEAISLHERLIEPVRDLTGASGAFYYAWTLVYGPLAALVAVLLGRFVWSLEPAVRIRIVLGGVLFVSGALGMELVESSLLYESSGTRTMLVRLSVTVEETLELSGLSVFVYALLLQLRHYLDERRTSGSAETFQASPGSNAR